jgi:hypothetical protein
MDLIVEQTKYSNGGEIPPHATLLPIVEAADRGMFWHPATGLAVRRISDILDADADARKYAGKRNAGFTNGYSRYSCESPGGVYLLAYGSDGFHSRVILRGGVGPGLWPQHIFSGEAKHGLGEAQQLRWGKDGCLYYIEGSGIFRIIEFDPARKQGECKLVYRHRCPIVDDDHAGDQFAGIPFVSRDDGAGYIYGLETGMLFGPYPSRPDLFREWARCGLRFWRVDKGPSEPPNYDGTGKVTPTWGHEDWGVTAAGETVWVYQANQRDRIEMLNPATGEITALLHQSEWGGDVGQHLATSGIPGWILMSTYGPVTPDQKWSGQQLFLLELCKAPRIVRLGPTYCAWAGDSKTSSYFCEAFASANRGGTHIHWGANLTGNLELYEMDLTDVRDELVRLARREPEVPAEPEEPPIVIPPTEEPPMPTIDERISEVEARVAAIEAWIERMRKAMGVQ